MSARPTPAVSVPALAGAATASAHSSAAKIPAILAPTAPDRSVRRTLMRKVVDGMNVIGTRPDGWWRDRRSAQRRLVAQLAALGEPLTVVFDGREHPVDAPGGIEVRFARHADDAIAELAG